MSQVKVSGGVSPEVKVRNNGVVSLRDRAFSYAKIIADFSLVDTSAGKVLLPLFDKQLLADLAGPDLAYPYREGIVDIEIDVMVGKTCLKIFLNAKDGRILLYNVCLYLDE